MSNSSSNPFLWLAHPALLYHADTFSLQFALISILHLCLCFVLLGVCASDYLCPNVSNVTSSRPNKASRGILTAIMLSWCNSSPDLFSNFISWTSSDAADLSVGEVLGSCGAILCVVQGAIFISISSTPLNIELSQCHNVLRDLCFILLSIIILFYICLRNEVTVLNCILMISLYVSYLLSKVIFKTSEVIDGVDGASITSDILLGPNTELDSALFSEADSGIKPSLLTAIDYTNLLHLMESSSALVDDVITMRTLNSNRLDENIITSRPLTEPVTGARRQPYQDAPLNHSSPSTFNRYFDNEDQNATETVLPPQIKFDKIIQNRLDRFKSGISFLLVPHLIDFQSKSLGAKVLAVTVTPFAFFFRLTCPQYEDILEVNDSTQILRLKSYQLLLLLTHSIFAPVASLILLSSIIGFTVRIFYWPVVVLTSVVLLISVTIFTQRVKSQGLFSLNSGVEERSREKVTVYKHSKYIVTTFNFIGILNSILWISVLAADLIEIIELYQRFTGISEAILGLTIFSWGNSISDLMSNVAMCQLYQRFPARDEEDRIQSASNFFFIALGACFGGILLNSLIGVGLSGFVAMLMGASGSDTNKWWFERSIQLGEPNVDYKFIVSAVSIIIQTIALIVAFSGIPTVIAFFQERQRKIGVFMCIWWALTTLCNVFIEICSGS